MFSNFSNAHASTPWMPAGDARNGDALLRNVLSFFKSGLLIPQRSYPCSITHTALAHSSLHLNLPLPPPPSINPPPLIRK